MTGRTVSLETRRKLAIAKEGKPRPDLAERNRKNSRLSAADIAEIKSRLELGETGVSIAAAFSVSTATISEIKTKRRYS